MRQEQPKSEWRRAYFPTVQSQMMLTEAMMDLEITPRDQAEGESHAVQILTLVPTSPLCPLTQFRNVHCV